MVAGIAGALMAISPTSMNAHRARLFGVLAVSYFGWEVMILSREAGVRESIGRVVVLWAAFIACFFLVFSLL